MARLIVIKGTDEGKHFELAQETVGIGRDSTNHIRLTDTEISRRHAEIRATPEGYRLVDKGSANGSYVNGKSVKDVLLHPGDQIHVGQSILMLSDQRPDAASAGGAIADRINMIARNDVEMASAIVGTIGETEGSRILSRPDPGDSGPWSSNGLAYFTILYESAQAISQVLDITQLLEKLMDLLLKSIVADRACILLRDPESGEFEPKALRWRAGIHEEKMSVSRTIVDHVLSEKQGVLVSDATRDDRFSGGESITRFGIREVICVPMRGRQETLGVIYLDTRSTARDVVHRRTAAGKFTEDHLRLAAALGHQSAVAIENSRFHQAMVQAERLAAIGQTIAALSHHIKNILQGLRSGGEILKMGINEKDENFLKRGWTIVEKNQAKIYELVLDMLSYSKEREPNIEVVDLNEIVRDVVELMENRSKELSIKLEVRLDEKLPKVQADPEGIHRSLLNIVGNAFDAVESRTDARIVIGTTLESDGEWARIAVLDNGNGIAADKINDIFKPFVSSKGARGTGLGLAVSRKVLREHGGDILVQSQLGKGSRFILRLPIRNPLGLDMSVTQTLVPGMKPPEEN